MTVAVVGLGLIGGSIAKAIKANTAHRVVGFDLSAGVLEEARDSGAIDQAGDGTLCGVDLVLLALYPRDSVDFMKAHVDSLPSGSTVVDLCGVKRFVCQELEALFQGRDITFIGGHPMAGRECSGFSCSTGQLFQNASMILTPDNGVDDGKVTEIGDFFRSLGFGHIQLATPEHHDEMIAFTSQLAHVLSSAYVQCPTARQHMGFSAGSFQDLTRVAKLNEAMWTELFLHNADFLTLQLDELIEILQVFQKNIAAKDATALRRMLKEGREIKEQLTVDHLARLSARK